MVARTIVYGESIRGEDMVTSKEVLAFKEEAVTDTKDEAWGGCQWQRNQ